MGREQIGRRYSVLFLCTGNSARSIMAEAILNHKGKPAFTAYSAGSHPSGKVRPEALQQLDNAKISTAGLRSKSWEEFGQPGAPKIDLVFTVCDAAAAAGHPITAHWGVPDPAAATGDLATVEQAFRDAFVILDRRVGLFLSLPFSKLDLPSLKEQLQRVGQR